MEFSNLSPFHSMAFQSLDLAGHYCTTVVTKVGYRVVIDPAHGASTLQVMDEEPVSLTLADEYFEEDPDAGVRKESDLAPFKPACDLLILGSSWAPKGTPAAHWPARVTVSQTESDKVSSTQFDKTPLDKSLIDKTLHVYAPGYFQKDFFGWSLVRNESATEIPLRWDHAFGGNSKIYNSAHHTHPDQPEWLLNEASFANPLGCGWMDKRHRKLARRADKPVPETITAPCFFYPNEAMTSPVFIQHANTALSIKDMNKIAQEYPYRAAGFGVVGRSWAPRVAFTGTYDEHWQEERWPALPNDFDERYWNCAPQDQQCPWPAPDCTLATWFLFSPRVAPQGYVELQLPGHRAFVMARLYDDTPIPISMQIDTLLLDTDAQTLEVVWRCRINNSPALKKLEARFESDATQPLLKFTNAGALANANKREVA